MDFLQGVKMTNVIPANVSIAEASLYVIEHSEGEFCNIIKSIGLGELAHLESTGTVITNEASIKDIFDKIIDWLKEKWGSVKELFERALTAIMNTIDSFKKKISTKEFEGFKKKASLIKEKDKDGNIKVYGKTYEYTKLDEMINTAGPVWEALNKFNEKIHQIASKAVAVDDEGAAKEIFTDLTEAKDGITEDISKIIGKEIGNESALVTAMVEYIRGNEVEIGKDYIIKNIDTIYKNVTDPGKVKSEIKKQLNNTKKDYNTDINRISKLKMKKDLTGENAKRYVEAVRKGKQISTGIIGAILTCVKQKYSAEMRILMKLAIAGKEKEVKEKTNESTVLESSSYQTELVSLFQW